MTSHKRSEGSSPSHTPIETWEQELNPIKTHANANFDSIPVNFLAMQYGPLYVNIRYVNRSLFNKLSGKCFMWQRICWCHLTWYNTFCLLYLNSAVKVEWKQGFLIYQGGVKKSSPFHSLLIIERIYIINLETYIFRMI